MNIRSLTLVETTYSAYVRDSVKRSTFLNSHINQILDSKKASSHDLTFNLFNPKDTILERLKYLRKRQPNSKK